MLGVCFLIPFRRYFVADMHGKLPFPEATATTEILVTGEQGGRAAGVLLGALGVGLVLDYLALALRAWRDVFTTALVPALSIVTEKIKAVFTLNTSAAVMGLGYIIGVRYAAIICAGSFLSYFVLVPLVARLGARGEGGLFPGMPAVAGLGAEDIFFEYVRLIGIGGIFAAGLISILKMSPVMVQAIAQVGKELARLRSGTAGPTAPRTDQDMPIATVRARARRDGARDRRVLPLRRPRGSARGRAEGDRRAGAHAGHLGALRRGIGLGRGDDLDHAGVGDDADHADHRLGRARAGARARRT